MDPEFFWLKNTYTSTTNSNHPCTPAPANSTPCLKTRYSLDKLVNTLHSHCIYHHCTGSTRTSSSPCRPAYSLPPPPRRV